MFTLSRATGAEALRCSNGSVLTILDGGSRRARRDPRPGRARRVLGVGCGRGAVVPAGDGNPRRRAALVILDRGNGEVDVVAVASRGRTHPNRARIDRRARLFRVVGRGRVRCDRRAYANHWLDETADGGWRVIPRHLRTGPVVSKYGGQHQALRRAGLPSAYGQPCARCGEEMRRGEPLDLDHDDYFWCASHAASAISRQRA
jgi:hypothetical protein